MANLDLNENGAGKQSAPFLFRAGLAVVALTFIFAAALTWRKWPDVIIDFGTQLYIPWRLADGAVLYRDLYYLAGGPFSQYFNALLFKVFGVSFLVLIISNLTFTALMLLVIYRYFFKASDTWTATMICLGIILVFAFAEYLPIGNYNYAAPYSHEALHGLVFSVFGLALLTEWIVKKKMWLAFAAGLCAGLTFLTKPDIFIALAAATIAAVVLACVQLERKFFATKSIAVFLAAAMIPLLGFFLLFLGKENAKASLVALVSGWLPAFEPAIIKNPFYQWCMGLDKPLIHLREIALFSSAIVLVVAFYFVALNWMKLLKSKWAKLPMIAVLLFPAIPILLWAVLFDWQLCGYFLPASCLMAMGLVAWHYKKSFCEVKTVFPLLWSIFALFLLLKMGVFPRIWHYGFVLAMPAFATAVYLLVWLLPVLFQKKFGISSWWFRLVTGSVFLIGYGNLFNQSLESYCNKNFFLGHGADRIVTFSPAYKLSANFYAATEWIEKWTPTNATLAVLPQGVTINYLTRRVNPTPCIFWHATVAAFFGESNMTVALKENPPDYIMLVHRDARFVASDFGKSPDEGENIMRWIRENYTTQFPIRVQPQSEDLGIEILKRTLVSAQGPKQNETGRQQPSN